MAVDTDVARLRRGDLNGLSELIARNQNRQYRYLLRIVEQTAEAEDLFQQTWLKVVEKNRSFDANRKFRRVALYAGAQSGDRSSAPDSSAKPKRPPPIRRC